MKSLDKSKFNNDAYSPGASVFKIVLWTVVSAIFIRPAWNILIGPKVRVLRMFGAKIGKRCYIKQGVHIKSPWLLEVGDYVGLGENCWIDNIVKVTLEDHVTLSQGAMLVTGNHNFKSESFKLLTGEITLKRGSWVSTRAIVGPGVTVADHSIVGMGSVLTQDNESHGIYRGNPALKVAERVISED